MGCNIILAEISPEPYEFRVSINIQAEGFLLGAQLHPMLSQGTDDPKFIIYVDTSGDGMKGKEKIWKYVIQT
jgi:hypothetical protein